MPFVLLEVNRSSEFGQCLSTNMKKTIKSMKSKIYFLGKGFDLAAMDRGPSECTFSGTMEKGFEKHHHTNKSHVVGVIIAKQAASTKEECYYSKEDRLKIWE